MKISMATLVVPDMHLEQIIKNVKEIGIDTIELRGKEPHISLHRSYDEVETIKEKCDENDISICAIASYIGYNYQMTLEEEQAELTKVHRFAKFCNILDCELLRVNTGGPHSHKATEQNYQQAAEWMKKACDVAAIYDVKITTEIHNGCLVDSADNALKMAKMVNRLNYGFTHDAGNMYITDVNYGLESVDRLGSRLFHVHVKDEIRIKDDTLPDSFHNETRYGDEIFQHRLLGTGAVDYISLFKALLKTKYSGYISLEIHGERDGIENLKHDFRVIKRKIEEIGY